MVLDATKWASSSDGDLPTQPVVNASPINNGTLHTYSITFDTAEGGIMATPHDKDLTEILWKNSSDVYHDVKNGGGGIAWGMGDDPERVAQRWRQETPTRNWGAGLSHSCTIYYEADGTGTFTLYIYVPYYWPGVDLAELIFAWTRFHTGGGTTARDFLDSASLQSYSARMQDNLFRVALWVWREPRVSFAETIKELMQESGALVGFGGTQSGGGRRSALTIRHFVDADEIVSPYDIESGSTIFGLQPPKITSNDAAVVNLVTCRFGSYYNYSNQDSAFDSPANPKNDENLLTFDQGADVVESIDLTRRHIMRAECADASLQHWLYDGQTFGVEITMGPLHFDFDCGYIIHATSASLGFDGTEDLLVIEKVIDWSTLSAVVKCININLIPPGIDPDHADVIDSLIGWYQPSGILSSGGSVTGWTDDSASGDDMGAMARGTAGAPSLNSAAINGLDSVDFTTSLTGLDLVAGNGPFDITVFAVVKIPATIASIDYLVDAAATTDRSIGVSQAGSTSNYYHIISCTPFDFSSDTITSGWQIICYRLRGPYTSYGSGGENIRQSSVHVSTSGQTDATMTQQITEDSWDGGLLSLGDIGIGCNHEGTDRGWDGEIAELVFYDRILRPGQIRRIMQGLREKYDL